MGHNKNSKKDKKNKEKDFCENYKTNTECSEEIEVLESGNGSIDDVGIYQQCYYCPIGNENCNYFSNKEHNEEVNRMPPGGGGNKPPFGPPGGAGNKPPFGPPGGGGNKPPFGPPGGGGNKPPFGPPGGGGNKPPFGPPGGGGYKPPFGPPGGGGHKPPFGPPGGYPPYFGPGHYPPYYNGYYPIGYPYIVPVVNGIPQGAAPNYIPSIYDSGVQSFSDNNDINICLYQYTYIWEDGGDSYWAYLSNVEERLVSGYRYLGNSWIPFSVRFRDIDHFVCYRSNNGQDDCPSCMKRTEDDVYEYIKVEYSKEGLREVYCKILSFIDVPEMENDYILQTAGIVEDKEVKIKVPIVKTRDISYRTILEVSYPDSYDDNIKEKIIDFTDEIADEINDMLYTLKESNNRYNPLDLYNKSVNLILDSLKTIAASFTLKLQNLNKGSDWFKEITLKIRKEKVNSKWKN